MTENRSNSAVPPNEGTSLGADILLVGQPNVGKSVLFSRLTGVRTIASNYPGTRRAPTRSSRSMRRRA
jgi:ferrous iron transport protein B